jgi:hypothetical protein
MKSRFRSIVTGAGDSIAGLASTYLKDSSYFRELCDENEWNPLSDTPLPINVAAKIPSLEAIVPAAKSKLDRAQNLVNSAKGRVEQVGRLSGQVSGSIEALDKALPAQYRGYTKEALEAIAEVNGAIGTVTSTLTDALEKADKSITKARYGGSRVRLVDWLLS